MTTMLKSFAASVLLVTLSRGFVLAQTLGDFQSELENQAQIVRDILNVIYGLILAIGGVIVIWAFSSKKQDARDYLIGYLVAIVLYGILREVVLDNL